VMLKKTSFKNINAIVFLFVVLLLAGESYLIDFSFIVNSPKPWHMQPFANEDSLSTEYLERYPLWGKERILDRYVETNQRIIEILVDGWGVPLNMDEMESYFSLFPAKQSQYAIHTRLANRTKHAERTELRNHFKRSLFIFGGDPLEYNRKSYIPGLGFDQMVFCGGGDDGVLKVLDSLLSDSLGNQFIAMTLNESRYGDKNRLYANLNEIIGLIKKYPGTIFIVQGTHRPILGAPETRKEYFSHLVPVVIANAKD